MKNQIKAIEFFFREVPFVFPYLQSKTSLPAKLNFALEQRGGEGYKVKQTKS